MQSKQFSTLSFAICLNLLYHQPSAVLLVHFFLLFITSCAFFFFPELIIENYFKFMLFVLPKNLPEIIIATQLLPNLFGSNDLKIQLSIYFFLNFICKCAFQDARQADIKRQLVMAFVLHVLLTVHLILIIVLASAIMDFTGPLRMLWVMTAQVGMC